MKKLGNQITLILIVVLLSVSTTAFSQRGNGGWGQNSNYGRLFNPKTVEIITGNVIAVERILLNKGMSYGIHLKVKTRNETISVHLGPTWYQDNQDIQFKKGDLVNITGSRITYQNNPAIIAMEATRKDFVLRLRDKNGYPVWSGWRKKGMRNGRKN